MDITHYAFAFYVFILLCGILWLAARLLRGGKKKDAGSFEKEQRLFALYQNIEDMLAGFEEYVEEARQQADGQAEKMRAMLDETRRLAGAAPEAPAEAAAPVASPKTPEAPAPDVPDELEARKTVERPKKAPEKMSGKIGVLAAQGRDVGEIAKTLGISIRQVELAIEMLRAKDK